MKNGLIDKQIDKKDVVYHVDSDGYLLDGENRYLLDEANRQIRLTLSQLELLRENGLMI